MCIVEEDATLVLVNDEFVELAGVPREELVEKAKWTNFVSSDDYQRMYQFHKERRDTGNTPPKQYEFKLIRKDGQHRHILLYVDLIPGTKMSVASLLDITARVHALEDLQSSREKYQNLVENINDIIYELDKNWCFIYVSPSVKNLTGNSPEFYLGKHFMEVVSEQDRQRVAERFEDFWQTGKVMPVDFRV